MDFKFLISITKLYQLNQLNRFMCIIFELSYIETLACQNHHPHPQLKSTNATVHSVHDSQFASDAL